ncbi:hypothetical protein Q6247_25435, partial [Klebsiella pneumoniae]
IADIADGSASSSIFAYRGAPAFVPGQLQTGTKGRTLKVSSLPVQIYLLSGFLQPLNYYCSDL